VNTKLPPRSEPSDPGCVFCSIAEGRHPASLVFQDAESLAFLDLRQFHPGHVLVIPRRHVPDIREIDTATAQAVAATVVRVARAVASVFPSDGLSVWHSAGEGTDQEVPHLHFHVHPRHTGDDLLRVYPARPSSPTRDVLDEWASRLQRALPDPTQEK
jgi:histidine triad (HIT) family protein